jgi:ubiquinone/menaquinone biosynthesis C-methylase UbiE
MMEYINYDSVAELYDLYAGTDYDYEFFLSEIKNRDTRVLELTSGTGRLSIPLIEAGANLTCVDISRGMLDILSEKLQRNKLSARVVCSDVCEMSFHSEFDLAIFPFQSFMELVGKDKQTAALEAIFHALEIGGMFICTMHNPVIRSKLVDGMLRIVGHFQKDDGTLVVSGFEQGGDPVVTRHQFFEHFDASGNMNWKRLLRMQFEFIEEQDFQEMAERAGFKVLEQYGNYDRSEFDSLRSPVMIWVLEKQAA